MNSKTMMKLAASSLLLGTAMVSTQSLAEATTGVKTAKAAEEALFKAERALTARDGDRAVRFAEQAVAGAPSDARYRAVLGQAYLLAGRFVSAETTFADTLALDPANGRAALSLSLAQTALGKNAAALATLDAIRVPVAVADLGLARALAGDTRGAIAMLSAAAREPQADAKTRQNLALSFALAGQWSEARTVAAQDVSPAEVPDRMSQWAKFTQPGGSWDQVASLLGVTPQEDPGQPERLALVQPSSEPVQTAAVVAPAVEAPITAAPASVVVAPAAAPAPARAVAAENPVAVAIAPSRPVAPTYLAAPKPAVRTALIRKPSTPVKIALTAGAAKPVAVAPVRRVALSRPTGGKFVVQLGAFSNTANVEKAWTRARGKLARLADFTPSSATFSVAGRASSLYRLSVSGFATRAQAVKLCEAVRGAGGQCFVRATAGDAPVQWVSRDKPVRFASR